MHPLANIAFMLAGAASIAALASTIRSHWSQIKRALRGSP